MAHSFCGGRSHMEVAERQEKFGRKNKQTLQHLFGFALGKPGGESCKVASFDTGHFMLYSPALCLGLSMDGLYHPNSKIFFKLRSYSTISTPA